jgi:(1->4)-alpha-D-glucan 1-alpha-D-glucosylmutase
MRKATKEAKVNTSWINPHPSYDGAVENFVAAVVDDPAFLQTFLPLAEVVAVYGMYNALAQTLLKLTVPGVPDIYQGNELWDFSLVDPDNRRLVDYHHRSALLAELRIQGENHTSSLIELTHSLLTSWRDGRLKMYVTYRTLMYRQQHPELFRSGAYLPLEVRGEGQEHVCAFMRREAHEWCIVLVPRLLARFIVNTAQPPLGSAVWKNTCLVLPEEARSWRFHNLFTGEIFTAAAEEKGVTLSAARVFAHLPIAVMTKI